MEGVEVPEYPGKAAHCGDWLEEVQYGLSREWDTGGSKRNLQDAYLEGV